MCGIAGFMARRDGVDGKALLVGLSDALAHRGPDGCGMHLRGRVGLVQTRLAIIDLQTGDQPLHEPGGATLIANGEIYNYIELTGDLSAKPITKSDCEPPLHLYRSYGLDFVDRLRGMYAIAIHDAAENRLVLARDPFGIKPLYYVETPDLFAFASEPQALLRAGILAPVLNESARDELLQLQFTTGRETPFAGINRLLPGEVLSVRDGRIIERRRRGPLAHGAPRVIGEEQALDQLDQALADSVAVHRRSDVPYGLFLSGGVDSSLVLSYMAEQSERPVLTYTVGFESGGSDERQAARELAKSCRAEHREVAFGEADFWALLPAVAAAMDDPAADYACLPTYKLAALAASDVKVVLTGEGGDELFAGYGRYRSLRRPWWLGGRNPRGRGILDRLKLTRRISAEWRDGIAAAESMESLPGRTRLQVAQAVDCADWLPNDLLTKLDRCLMAHALEGRTPFLDPVVADLAFRLPDGLKIAGGRGKHLLRRLLARRLPQAPALAAKQGFTVPVGTWIAAHGKRLAELMPHQPAIEPICPPERVAALFRSTGKHEGFAAWTLLFWVLWHRRHILGAETGGDVFDALQATLRGA